MRLLSGYSLFGPYHGLLGQCFDTAGAETLARAVDRGPLDIGVLSGLIYGIVVTAQKLPGTAHLRAFAAFFTLTHGGYCKACVQKRQVERG